ncbi:MAG: M23 family metallopeptidase [Deltaproteobacteria bacterium]|nr:M23 family metallopeptidase [Deltaproteobacteria bacterium]
MKRPASVALCVGLLVSSCRHVDTPAVHVVAEGETLSEIADRYGVALEALVRRNKLADPDQIFASQKLEIPSLDAAPSEDDEEAVAEGRAEEEDRAIDEAVVKLEEQERVAAAPMPSSKEHAADALIWPVDGVVISLFGEDDGARHDGIDIAAPEGSPIWAAADGDVLFAGEQKGYGLILVLRHAGDLVTVYGHNLANLAKEGDRVKQGQPIATVGQSGGQLTPAVHFEVRQAAVATNPLTALPR